MVTCRKASVAACGPYPLSKIPSETRLGLRSRRTCTRHRSCTIAPPQASLCDLAEFDRRHTPLGIHRRSVHSTALWMPESGSSMKRRLSASTNAPRSVGSTSPGSKLPSARMSDLSIDVSGSNKISFIRSFNASPSRPVRSKGRVRPRREDTSWSILDIMPAGSVPMDIAS